MSKRHVMAVGAGLALALMPTSPALADSPGYSPPPAAGDSCNAGHGTFGALGGYDNNAGVNDPGTNGAPGASNPHNPNPDGSTTGASNSGYSADCQSG